MKGATPLRQLSMFLNQTGPVWLAARSLIDGMREEKINYAVIGGLAVYAHGSQRTTSDIDILLARSDYEKFVSKFIGRGLRPRFEGAKKKFIDCSTQTPIDLILEGEYPGDGKPGPIAFPNPATCHQVINRMNVINLPKIIELKLAAYQKVGLRRTQDFADVVALVKHHKLDRSFAELIHPEVQKTFLTVVEELKANPRDPFNDEH